MNTVIRILSWVVLGLYVVNFVYYYNSFRESTGKSRLQIRKLLIAAVATHFLYLAILSGRIGHLPVGNVFQVLTTFAWVAALVYLSLEMRLNVLTMGVFFIPVVIFFQLISNLFLDLNQPLASVLKNLLFEVHVSFLISSYAAFTISFITSVMYILLSREMQSKNLGIFFQRLPSLELFDTLSNHAVNIGLVLGLVGMGIGVYMGTNLWEGTWFLDPKFLAVAISIGIYLLHFFSRKTVGWQGKRAAIVSVIGFNWLLFSFIFVDLFFSKFHNFH